MCLGDRCWVLDLVARRGGKGGNALWWGLGFGGVGSGGAGALEKGGVSCFEGAGGCEGGGGGREDKEDGVDGEVHGCDDLGGGIEE